MRDYAAEFWVKTYIAEPTRELLLTWQARAVRDEFRRKCDHAGMIVTPDGIAGLAVVLRHFPAEVIDAAVAELLASGVIRVMADPQGYIDPEHFEAQRKRSKYDRVLQAEHRARKRAAAVLAGLPGDVRNPDSPAVDPEVSDEDETGADSREDVRNPDIESGRAVSSSGKLTERQRSDQRETREESPAAGAAPPQQGRRSSTRKRTEIPTSWAPSDIARGLAQKLGIDLDSEAEIFVSRSRAQGETAVDWDEQFMVWLRREAKFRARAGKPDASAGAPDVGDYPPARSFGRGAAQL